MTALPTTLHSKIAAGLIGADSGDAVGSPVERLNFKETERRHGRVENLLAYTKEPSEHAQFTNHPSYSDATRLHLILCQAILDAEGEVTRGNFAKALAGLRSHEGALERHPRQEAIARAVERLVRA